MDFKNFLQINKIEMSDDKLQLALAGIEEMKLSTDILHPVSHIYRLLALYERFKKDADQENVDPSILIMSVIWHDVWKARLGTRNVLMTVYAQAREGIKASQLFKTEAQKYITDTEFINKVAYSIRKHSQIQFLRLRTPEAKLLWDLDKLDKWDPKRVIGIEDSFFAMKNILWKFLFFLVMINETDHGIHFKWLKGEFNDRKKDYFSKINLFK